MDKKVDIEENKRQLEDDTSVPCPYWLETIPYFFTFLFLTWITQKFIDVKPVEWYFSLYSYIFGGLCVLQWCYLLWERWYFYGPNGFYEIYWYCHMGLLMTGLGIILHLPNLLGQSMCLTLFPHLSFWIDFLLYPCFGRCVIGSASWMFDKATPLHEKLSSCHHFWYFPGVMIVLYGQSPISVWSYTLSIIQFIIMNFFSHFMTPYSYVDKNGNLRVLNICVGHECPDFLRPLPPFKWAIGKPYIYLLVIATIFYNLPFNYIAYIIIVGVQKLLNLTLHR